MDLKEYHEKDALIDALHLSPGWRKTFKENRRFNIWGLLFGWLYVGWLGMGGTAIFYFLMMLVPMTILGTVWPDTRTGICLGMAVMHIWIAFRVNQKYWKHVLKNHTAYEAAQPDAPVMYFDISKKRMVLCSILTLGFYDLYWMYQNWKALKIARKDPDNGPLGQTVFWIFYLYSLFKTIFKDADKVGFKSRYSAGVLFGTYLLMAIIAQSNAFPAFIFWMMIFISPFVFFPVMDAIRANNKALDEAAVPRRKITLGEVIILLIGGLIFVSSVYSHFPAKDENRMLIAFLEKGVPDYCLQNGYRMETWPMAAYDVLKPMHAQVESANDNLSPEEQRRFDEKMRRISRGFVDSIYQNLKQTEPFITMQEACLLLDQNAKAILVNVLPEFRQLAR